MDLLDRYVKAVNSFLPLEKQDDIVKELSANLQAQMDDREAQLGRPLSEIEQEAILQQHGHPMMVAGHYQINQGTLVFGRQLIGATLFPLYRKALSITLGVSLAICLVILIVLGVSGTPITFESVVNTILLQMVIQFAVVTAIFAAAELIPPEDPVERATPACPASCVSPGAAVAVEAASGIHRGDRRYRGQCMVVVAGIRPALAAGRLDSRHLSAWPNLASGCSADPAGLLGEPGAGGGHTRSPELGAISPSPASGDGYRATGHRGLRAPGWQLGCFRSLYQP